MILYSHSVTSRLQYIVNFFVSELGLGQIVLTTSQEQYTAHEGVCINYSENRIRKDEIWIVPHALLFEREIMLQKIETFDSSGEKAFFKTAGDWPFDVLAASFYLISRYEEYLPHQTDEYGRYDHRNSFAFRENLLRRPLVNCWLKSFRERIESLWPASGMLPPSFTFLPTYDIDMAWSYLHKGWWRNFGGLVQSLFRGEWAVFSERLRVLAGSAKDPFDAYSWLDALHERYQLKPYYFFLLSKKTGRYDKNISPGNKAMQALVRDHSARYRVGIHPSWRSGNELSCLKEEIDILKQVTGSPVAHSRQHYIRFTLPETFRILLDHGIKFDFSMGYGSINGFRASVASPFYWYDLEKDQQTDLMLFPFCFMDANSFYEQHDSPQQALEEMRAYYKAVREVNGHLVMIWHNPFLGDGNNFAGWKDVYEKFVKEVSSS